jgi:glycosyltransferase involved in cell wall biosynthesis
MLHDAVVAVVVPAYKERDHIARVITTMPAFVDHVVVVDDCSPDDTAEVARATGDPRLTVIRREKNGGVGAAIVTGHRAARELGADVNVVMAGDGQMDPEYLEQLLEPVLLHGYGFAKANRFFSMTSFAGMPRVRVVGSVALSFATKLASGYWHLFDPQNGYTALHREALDRLSLDRLAGGYSFENDLLIQLNILRVPAIDVPIPAVYGDEVSGIRLRKVVPELSRLLFKGFWRRFFYKYVLWSFSPVALFLLSGLALLTASLVIGGWVVAHTLGEPVATTGSVLLAVTPFLVGVQLVLYALLLDIQESPDEPVTASGLPPTWTGGALRRGTRNGTAG